MFAFRFCPLLTWRDGAWTKPHPTGPHEFSGFDKWKYKILDGWNGVYQYQLDELLETRFYVPGREHVTISLGAKSTSRIYYERYPGLSGMASGLPPSDILLPDYAVVTNAANDNVRVDSAVFGRWQILGIIHSKYEELAESVKDWETSQSQWIESRLDEFDNKLHSQPSFRECVDISVKDGSRILWVECYIGYPAKMGPMREGKVS